MLYIQSKIIVSLEILSDNLPKETIAKITMIDIVVAFNNSFTSSQNGYLFT